MKRGHALCTRALPRLFAFALGCVFSFAAAAPAQAGTIYVDGNLPASCAPGQYSVATRTCGGGDGSGFTSFAAAISAMQPGDTVAIRGGTYRTPLNITKSGTATAHLRFVAHASETVRIDLTGWGGSPADGINITARQFIDIVGVDVVNAPGYGVTAKAGSTNITISDVEIAYSRNGGMVFEGGSYITVARASVHHSNNGGSAHEAVTFSGVQQFSITDSNVFDNAKEGIDAKYGSRAGVIARNHTYRNNGPNIYIDAAANVRVQSNRCHDAVSTLKPCIMIGTESTYNPAHYQTSDITIDNNLIYASGAGISFWLESASLSWARFDRIRIEYNTIVDNNVNNWGGVFIVNGTGNFGSGNTIRNNILMGNGGRGIRDDAGVLASFTIANNLFQNGESSTMYGVSPVFTSTSPFVNRAARDYHLTSASPARFVGQSIGDITTDFDGAPRPTSATDVGAYQYGGAAPPPPAAPSCTLQVSPTSITQGSTTTLSWTTANATSLSIDQAVGSVTPVGAGSLVRTPSVTTTYTGTATGAGGTGTCSTTVTVSAAPPPTSPPPTSPPPSGSSVWNSWDVVMQAGAPQATVTAAATGIRATVEVYESTNNDGVAKGALFSAFNPGTHPEAFNETQQYWGAGTGWVYPYGGKSTMGRGSDSGESRAPLPLGVRDLQLHPPDNLHYTVAAFRIPQNGNYTISNLGVRRVSNLGGSVFLRVFNTQQTEIATLTATADRGWTVSANTYTLDSLVAGSYLYFAVDNGGDYAYDATEIAWTVTAAAGSAPPPPPPTTVSSVWNSWDVTTQGGSPQGVVAAAATGATAQVEFYESINDGGVARGSLFGSFTAGIHPETFNNVQQYWGVGTGWVYPYAGKSTVNRGADAGETNAGAPLGVRDLQLHPPDNPHMVVAAFKVPSTGTYTISNLGVRRVSGFGADVVFHIFNTQQVEIASLTATADQAWIRSSQAYTLTNLPAGTYLYFAVDRGADFYYYDAAEISWTVTRSGS